MGLSLSPSSATLAGAPATTGCLKPYLLPSSNCPGSCARASCPKSPWQPHSHCLPTPKGTRRHQANTTFSYVLPTLPSTDGCPEWDFSVLLQGEGRPLRSLALESAPHTRHSMPLTPELLREAQRRNWPLPWSGSSAGHRAPREGAGSGFEDPTLLSVGE